MVERMKAILRSQNLCVLATCHDNKPHCSLMAYVTDSKVRTVYMATREDTTKYLNLMENREVSLLVDTRAEADTQDPSTLRALTVYGHYQPLTDPERERVIGERLEEKHPHLATLVRHPKCVIVPIRIVAFLLLEGVETAHYEVLD
ncbi:Pyridoxamine 5'-phosphate oxidase [Desulfacinum hydrothermale DSM 13146]|uniref:Pyridoxamine 5'-phosphate oxidase n=1 Tax=Desulfacinum hydrothermale DSM 13146 TaxID=1121390 RepID=A0A1W1X8D4_9BACT|nr:pyridoxamine 5'-phosphate oxidase family protein [Desulfacinum hydrothermale]SMC20245.1 Pyridoxamine 5'-phosphate oxidase [Desulfacinum hydrothermale DSM 13146]